MGLVGREWRNRGRVRLGRDLGLRLRIREGIRGFRVRLREKRSAAAKEKAERESRRRELVGRETRK